MALTYEQAIATLKSMFPGWEEQILAELLESNSGHLENTIEMVLSMDAPEQAQSQASPASAKSQTRSPRNRTKSPSPRATASPRTGSGSRSPKRQEVVLPPAAPTSLLDDELFAAPPAPAPRSPRRRSQEGGNKPKNASRLRVQLADDFLRLPQDPEVLDRAEQERRDAMLAEMLQNEIFRNEVMQNQDFSSHFNGDRHGETGSPSSQEKSASEYAAETFTAFKEKVSSMSEVMKRKMNEMYMNFQTATDSPAHNDPRSRQPLMDDHCSDDEEDNVSSRNDNPDRDVHRRQHHHAAADVGSPGARQRRVQQTSGGGGDSDKKSV